MRRTLKSILMTLFLSIFTIAMSAFCLISCGTEFKITFKEPPYAYFRGDVADAYDLIERQKGVDYSFAFSYLTLSDSGETISSTKAELQGNTVYLKEASRYTLYVTAEKNGKTVAGSTEFDVVGETPVLLPPSLSLVYGLGTKVRVSILLDRASPTVIPASSELVVDYYTYQESQAPDLEASGNSNPKLKTEIDTDDPMAKVEFDKLGLYEFHVVAYNGDVSATATFKVKVLPDQSAKVEGISAYKNAEFGEHDDGTTDASVIRLVGSPDLSEASYAVLEEEFVEGQVARFEFYGRNMPSYIGIFNRDYTGVEDPNSITNGGIGYVFTMERATVANSARLYGFTRMSNGTSPLRASNAAYPLENFGFNDLEDGKHYFFEISLKTTGETIKGTTWGNLPELQDKDTQDMALFFSLYEVNENDSDNPYTIVAHSQARFENGFLFSWFEKGEDVKGKLVAYSSISKDITFKYYKDTLIGSTFDKSAISFDKDRKVLSWEEVEGAVHYVVTTSDSTSDRFAVLDADTTSIDLSETYEKLGYFSALGFNVYASVGNNVFSGKKYEYQLVKYPEGLENTIVNGEVVGYDLDKKSVDVALSGNGAFKAAHFQDEVGYVAFDETYTLDEYGTYVDVYFTGNNMPQVEFFATDILGNIRNKDGDETSKGFIVTNGHAHHSAYAETPTGIVGGYSEYDLFYEYGVTTYNRLTGGAAWQLGGARITESFSDGTVKYLFKGEEKEIKYSDFSMYSLMVLQKKTQNYKYTVGMFKDSFGGVWIESKLYKVDGETQTLFTSWYSKVKISADQESLTTGQSIAGKIVLHAAFKGSSATSGEDYYTKFTCSKPYAENTVAHFASENATFNADGTVTLKNGLNSGAAAQTANPLGYIALEGEYALTAEGTYMDFYFTGSNMPQVSFFNKYVTNNLSAKNGDANDNSGVILLNDMRYSATGIANCNAHYRYTVMSRWTTTFANMTKHYTSGSNASNQSPLSAAVLKTMPEQRFKYTVGFYLNESGSVCVFVDMDKVDENGDKTEDYFAMEQDLSLASDTFTGNRIVIYGSFNGDSTTGTTFRYSKPYRKEV